MSEATVGTHDLVWIEGPDAVSFADGQLSQDIAGMEAGEVRRSFLLEPRGKLRAIVWVLRGGDRVGLATWAGTGEGVAVDLERFRFRVDASVSWDAAVGTVSDPPPDAAPGRWTGTRDGLVAVLPTGAWPRALVVPAGEGGGYPILERVRAGEPVFGIDVDEATIPQETGLVPEAVSFTKGCYLGQELVARIDSRGHVNRTLRRVVVSGALPPTGAEVVAGGVPVGVLGSVAPAPTGAEALALVRRETAAGTSVLVRWPGGEADAVVEDVERAHTLRTDASEHVPDMGIRE